MKRFSQSAGDCTLLIFKDCCCKVMNFYFFQDSVWQFWLTTRQATQDWLCLTYRRGRHVDYSERETTPLRYEDQLHLSRLVAAEYPCRGISPTHLCGCWRGRGKFGCALVGAWGEFNALFSRFCGRSWWWSTTKWPVCAWKEKRRTRHHPHNLEPLCVQFHAQRHVEYAN